MAIIIGGNPKAEKQQPVAAPESKIKRDVEPVEVRTEEVAQSEEPEVAAPAVKKPVKKARKNGKKQA